MQRTWLDLCVMVLRAGGGVDRGCCCIRWDGMVWERHAAIPTWGGRVPAENMGSLRAFGPALRVSVSGRCRERCT